MNKLDKSAKWRLKWLLKLIKINDEQTERMNKYFLRWLKKD